MKRSVSNLVFDAQSTMKRSVSNLVFDAQSTTKSSVSNLVFDTQSTMKRSASNLMFDTQSTMKRSASNLVFDTQSTTKRSASNLMFYAGEVELIVLGCQVDMLGTNCDQCVSMVQCCFASTETLSLIRTATLTFIQLLNSVLCPVNHYGYIRASWTKLYVPWKKLERTARCDFTHWPVLVIREW